MRVSREEAIKMITESKPKNYDFNNRFYYKYLENGILIEETNTYNLFDYDLEKDLIIKDFNINNESSLSAPYNSLITYPLDNDILFPSSNLSCSNKVNSNSNWCTFMTIFQNSNWTGDLSNYIY